MFWTLARRAPRMWLNPLKSAPPPKTMSMVRARRWQEEENLATRKVRLLGVLQSVAASLRESHQCSPTLILVSESPSKTPSKIGLQRFIQLNVGINGLGRPLIWH